MRTDENPANTQEFLALYGQHQRQILGSLIATVQNLADADDLLQQTSLVLWKKFGEFDPKTDFCRWACRVAHLEAMNFLRQKRRSRVYFSDELLEELAEERLDRVEIIHERRHALQWCIEKLSPRDRDLVTLCYDDRISIKEVAQKLGRSCGSVYRSLRRIRGVLFDCVNATMSQEDEE